MTQRAALRRAYRSFWALTAVAVLLVGALSRELAAPPSPLVGTAVAVTGLLLALVVLQCCRIMLAIDRATVSRPRRRRGPFAALGRHRRSGRPSRIT